MARPFNVTAAADSVRLDSQGRGATTYTVSNISGRARRGRARLVPGNPAQSSWLSIEGEAERDFTADGTQQYVVKIAVPPGTPAGKFTFGLDVVSVDNPDEDFTEGPKVAFEVAPPPPKKPFPWWIIAVIVALLAVGGLVAWLIHHKHAGGGGGGKVTMKTCASDSDCSSEESCAELNGAKFCLLKTGQSCKIAAECISGNCSGDTCQPGKKSCLTNGDCASPYQCVSQVCMVPNGQTCSSPLDCQSGNCEGGTCQPKICRNNADCGGGFFVFCDSTGHCRTRIRVIDRNKFLNQRLQEIQRP